MADEQTPQTPDTKLELTPEQQELVNKQITARLARQKETLTADITARLSADFETKMQAEIEKVKAELAPKPKDGEGEGEDAEEAKKAQTRALLEAEQNKTKLIEKKYQDLFNSHNQLQDQFKATLKTNAMREAMTGLGFHNPAEVELLTSGKVFYDDATKSYLVKENGVIKENANLEPMTLKEFYAEYAAKNPWHVNSDAKSGAGSTPGSAAQGQITKKSDFKTVKQKADWITANGYDAFEKLPA